MYQCSFPLKCNQLGWTQVLFKAGVGSEDYCVCSEGWEEFLNQNSTAKTAACRQRCVTYIIRQTTLCKGRCESYGLWAPTLVLWQANNASGTYTMEQLCHLILCKIPFLNWGLYWIFCVTTVSGHLCSKDKILLIVGFCIFAYPSYLSSKEKMKILGLNWCIKCQSQSPVPFLYEI